MKQHLQQLIVRALETLREQGSLDCPPPTKILIENTRDKAHGDLACNVAMVLAKAARRKPRELAELIVGALPASAYLQKTELAGPGFINFFLLPTAYNAVIGQVLERGAQFGCSARGRGERVQVEFVSANPTGPLHVGHGRGAAYGACVANLLEAVGFDVQREYYVNDAGRQMDILAVSAWLRYLDLCGEAIPFPSNAYQGDYVWDIAANLHRERGEALRQAAAEVLKALPADEPEGGDKEAHIDALIERAKALLGEALWRQVFDAGLGAILADIRQDLEAFGVRYDNWYSERALMESGKVDAAIARLQSEGHIYEQNGALWFRTTALGDEKDRVVVRENGLKTYFASDIAYHAEKFERGFARAIDVWGADHHGYVPRVRAALSALGKNPDKLDVLLVQFAILYRGGERVQMSTRSGSFVTLRELRAEVGNDAARFFYVMRKCEQHMDFDLDLAKSQSSDNPVYYIQYAHARVCSVMRQLREKDYHYDQAQGLAELARLDESHEQSLIQLITRYPEVLESAALANEPHLLAHYLRELAHGLHTYYNAHQFLSDDAALRNARLTLISAVRQVLANGLQLLGVFAPESM